MIAVGTAAPDFSLPTADGRTLTLSSLRGAPVVLYFYPKDDTPGCTQEACDFRDSLDALQALGAKVVGVSGDSVASHAKFTAKYGLTFPLVADTSRDMLRAYGVWQTKQQYGRSYEGIVRSTFLIDAAGVVRQVWDKVTVQKKNKAGEVVHRHVDEVRAALEALG